MSGIITPSAPEDPKKLVEGNETRIGIRADAIVDEQPVAIVAEIGKNIFVQLDKAATLGTPMSFAYWLKDVYAVEGLETMFLPPVSALNAATPWPDGATPDGNYVTSAEYRTAYNQYKLAPVIFAEHEPKGSHRIKTHPKLGKAGGAVTARRTLVSTTSRTSSDAGS